jgi:hypothetical protein
MNEFTKKQLQALYNVVAEEVSKLEGKKKAAEKYFYNSAVGDELIEFYNSDLEDYRLWIIQIINAMDEVSQRETMQSN